MKMKFILAIAILAFYFTSCKKAYTCSCTTTIVEPVAGTFVSKDDSTPYSKKMNKKTAQSACDNKRASIEQENKNLFSSNGKIPLTANISTSCTLQ